MANQDMRHGIVPCIDTLAHGCVNPPEGLAVNPDRPSYVRSFDCNSTCKTRSVKDVGGFQHQTITVFVNVALIYTIWQMSNRLIIGTW